MDYRGIYMDYRCSLGIIGIGWRIIEVRLRIIDAFLGVISPFVNILAPIIHEIQLELITNALTIPQKTPIVPKVQL